MTGEIHPTAIVDPHAELAKGVSVGAHSIIGPGVKLGRGTKIWHQANIWGNTTIGEDCEVYPFASVGMKTQDLKFEGGNPGTRIGDRNVIREYVSINAATIEGEYTEIGDDNLFLAYCHVGHCCKIGNHLIASNGATFAGHVIVEDHVGIGGGGTAIHQFCHIGQHAFIGGCAKVEQDIPPFMLGDGHPAKIRVFNKIGLERNGFNSEQLSVIKRIFKIFYRDGYNRQQALAELKKGDISGSEETKAFIAFAESTERGLAGGS